MKYLKTNKKNKTQKLQITLNLLYNQKKKLRYKYIILKKSAKNPKLKNTKKKKKPSTYKYNINTVKSL